MTAPWSLGPAILFCPADRPDRYEKAAERADAVILDLEDAVDASRRPAARSAIVAHPLDPARAIVRVNATGSPDLARDLAALARTEYRTIMLPKVSGVADLADLADFRVVALCETAAGIVSAPAIAASPAVVALMWGAEDLIASLGGTSSRAPDGRYRDVARAARSAVLLAAGAAGKAAIDAVHIDLDDAAGLAAEAEDAAASGFAAVACIHPRQVPVIRAAYRPSDAAVGSARALLDAASSGGVFVFRGAMVDEPLLRAAREVLRRAVAADRSALAADDSALAADDSEGTG